MCEKSVRMWGTRARGEHSPACVGLLACVCVCVAVGVCKEKRESIDAKTPGIGVGDCGCSGRSRGNQTSQFYNRAPDLRAQPACERKRSRDAGEDRQQEQQQQQQEQQEQQRRASERTAPLLVAAVVVAAAAGAAVASRCFAVSPSARTLCSPPSSQQHFPPFSPPEPTDIPCRLNDTTVTLACNQQETRNGRRVEPNREPGNTVKRVRERASDLNHLSSLTRRRETA